MKRTVGLTGGVAAGKTTVARMFQALGAGIVEADAVARELVQPGEPAYHEVVTHFGPCIVKPDGTLDRKELGRIVFANEAERRALNSILHPRMIAVMEHRAAALHDQGAEIVIVDAALHGEWHCERDPFLETLILVVAPREIQLQRLMERAGCTREEAEHWVAAQMPEEQKRKLAHYLIEGAVSLEETRRQVEEVWGRLNSTNWNIPIK